VQQAKTALGRPRAGRRGTLTQNVPLGSRVVSQKVNFLGQGNKGRLISSAVRRRTGEYPPARLLLPGGLEPRSIRALEVELQRKLNLALIVLATMSGPDPAEGRGRGVVERAGRGRDSITAEAGRGKVRMVRQVKNFCAELQVCALGRAEVLEKRAVHAMITGTKELRRGAAHWSIVGLPDGSCHRWAREGRGIDPLIHIVRTRGDALAGNQQGIVAIVGRSADHAGHGIRLAILQGQNPVGAPSAEHGLNGSFSAVEELPALAEGQIVVSTHMYHFRDVEITESVVALYPETG